MEEKTPLYQQLARELENQIESGIFCMGEKLPSVREFADARKISVITVLKAYQVIQNKGLIHSMPKSGYYISFHNAASAHPPVSATPQEVHISGLVRSYMGENSGGSSFFGTGLPAKDIVPVSQLNNILIHELRRDNLQQLASVHGEGDDLFRAQIVKYLYMRNIPAVKENVMITNGCTEGIFLCMSHLCRPGDQIIMQSPCSFGVLQMAEMLNLKVLEVRPDGQDGIDVDHLRYFLEKYEIKGIYLNPNINNPLGTIQPLASKKMIADLVNEKKVFLIEDDVMSDLYYGKEQPLPIKAFDKNGYVIYCSSFTKTLLPTYRIGWVYSERLFDRIVQLKKIMNVGTPLLQQAVLTELLETGNYGRYTRKARTIYAERTSKLREDILSAFSDGVQVSKPEGGYLLWIHLPDGVDPDLYYHCLQHENISVLPGSIFSPSDRFINCFRINAANYSAAMKPVIQRMGEIARECRRGVS